MKRTRPNEKHHETQRRMSVASESDRGEDDNEEATELLGNGNDHRQPSKVTSCEKDAGGSHDRSQCIRPLSIAFAILLLVTVVFSSCTILFLKPSLRSLIQGAFGGIAAEWDENQMLGIELHPQHHIFRAPKTITHHWTITSGIRSPDGVKKLIFLVNGDFPGPTIECRSGDKIAVHVTNELESGDGVSIHWHGLNMRGANGMDGAVGFTQCSIPAGATFKYEFEIDDEQAGTFWWHAHSQVQRGDGMYGGFVVHRHALENADLELYEYKKEVLLLVGDWYHRSATEILQWYTSAGSFGNEPVPDSLLINGVGRFICSMAVPARPVECEDIDQRSFPSILRHSYSGSQIRLRIINVGTLAGFTLSLGPGFFSPLTVDGGYPIFNTAANFAGILYPGQRLDILLAEENLKPELKRGLHISLDPENFKYPNPALRPNQSFPLLPGVVLPTTEGSGPESSSLDTPHHFDLSTAVASTDPSYPKTNPFIPEVADQVMLLYTRTEKLAKFSNHPKGFINRTSWSPQTYPLISLPRAEWDENQLIPYIPLPKQPIWVDIIINNLDDGSHPFHLHGYDFYVIASSRSDHGWGSYSPFKDGPKPEYNIRSPLKMDTVNVPRRGYVVIRFKADNPGIWMLHCHVLFHQGSGMAMGIQVGGGEQHQDVDVSAKEGHWRYSSHPHTHSPVSDR